ncbi:hypothetical protein D9M68_572880 [compost metagenome]
MPSGWVRWMMEQFHFPFQVIYPKNIDAGNLNAKYDVILFIGGGIPSANGGGFGRGRTVNEEEIPEQFRGWLGSVTAEKSIPQLKTFMENGGNIVTVGSSTNLIYHLGLPVKNMLVEKKKDGSEGSLPGDKFYIPGSLLKVNVDTQNPSNWGMPAEVSMVFNNSPVFKLEAGASDKGIKPLAWFGKDAPLQSGWAWGQDYLKDGVVGLVAPIGKGKLYAYSTEITFRAQSHSTFKMLFNELYKQK